MSLLIGAVADDFTGATDLANTLVGAGLRTVQLIGVPGDVEIGDAEAVVVALKSRTAPVAEAVAESVAATDWLRARGARQVISKYCSTFDSTPTGNIGPIADAMMAELDTDFALVCPAFPGAGRTIYKGNLFVLDQPLHESPMKDHPLTPMRDSNLMRLMEAQSDHRCGLIDLATVREGCAAIRHRVEALRASGHRYGVIDVVEDSDLMTIGEAARDHVLVTGGSGIAMGLPAAWRDAGAGLGQAATPTLPPSLGRTVILAGSCSAATREQIANLPKSWPARQVTAAEVANDPALADTLCDWARAQGDTPCLIYSSADPEDVAKSQAAHGRAEAGEMIERLMGKIAATLTKEDVGRLIVAGGETSGAVVSALGVTALRIGPQIAPGVPWCETLDGPKLALALKSGNFGGPTFFQDALDMLA